MKVKVPKQLLVTSIGNPTVTNDLKSSYKTIRLRSLSGEEWTTYVRQDYNRSLFEDIKVGDLFTGVRLLEKSKRVNDLDNKSFSSPIGNTLKWINLGNKTNNVRIYKDTSTDSKLIISRSLEKGKLLVVHLQPDDTVTSYQLTRVEIFYKFSLFL